MMKTHFGRLKLHSHSISTGNSIQSAAYILKEGGKKCKRLTSNDTERQPMKSGGIDNDRKEEKEEEKENKEKRQ